MSRRQKLGLLCHHCGEPFGRIEFGFVSHCVYADGGASIARHRECELRRVVGSIGHLLRLCSCYGGTFEDPPHLTKRQAAKLAAAAWTITSVDQPE